jgi:hypothetical protein
MSPEKPVGSELENMSVAERKRFLMLQAMHGADECVEIDRHNGAVSAEAYGQIAELEQFSSNDLMGAHRMARSALKKYSYRPRDIIENLPWEHAEKWCTVIKFLTHDIVHVGEFALANHSLQVAFHRDKARGDKRSCGDYMKEPFAGEWKEFYRDAMCKMDRLLKMHECPWQFFKALAEIELGRDVSCVESIDMSELVWNIAKMAQLRFVFDDYALTTPDNRFPERNEIVIDLSTANLETNPGMIWSIIYNLVKNAGKELSCKYEDDKLTPLASRFNGELPEKPIKLHLKVDHLDQQGVTVVHVVDSGEGLSVDEIMNSMKEILENDLVDGSNLKPSVVNIVNAWKENPFAVRALRLGDVYDLAGVARASGFVTRDRLGDQFSSGMGLWGVNHLTNKMGGQIIYTNTVQGGAMFTLLIPDHFFQAGTSKRTVRSQVLQFRKKLESGGVQIDLPLAV